MPGGLHRHERPPSGLSLQHFLLLQWELQGEKKAKTHKRKYLEMFQEELSRTRELPVPPQPRRTGVLARSDDNLAGDHLSRGGDGGVDIDGGGDDGGGRGITGFRSGPRLIFAA